MTNKIILFAAAGAIAFSTGASALPLNKLSMNSGVILARTVCDDDGRCWREANPAEDVTGEMLRGFEGRSVHRDGDRDHDTYRDHDHPRSGDDDNRDVR